MKDDMISRQAAIEKLTSNLTYMHTFGADRSIDLIEELPPAQSGWIPCSERLPEIKEHHISDTVICYCSNGAYAFSQLQENIFGQCGFECERDDDYHEAVGEVVAWMPLPKPWEGGQDDSD